MSNLVDFNNYMYGGYPGMVNPQQGIGHPQTWLNQDQIRQLQQGLGSFTLAVTAEEVMKAQCNHYYPNGVPATIKDADNSGGCTCAICGKHFTPSEFSKDDVQQVVTNVLDILETIKYLYWSLDPKAGMEFCQIIPLVEKIPRFYENAINDFKKHDAAGGFNKASGTNPFNMFSAMMAGQPMYGYNQPNMGGMNMGMGYQPNMYAQAPQPNMGGMPMNMGMGFNPLTGQPMPVNSNPMSPGMPTMNGFNTNMPGQTMGAPAPGYQPQTPQGYSFNPTGAAAQQPAAPTAAAPAQPVAEKK